MSKNIHVERASSKGTIRTIHLRLKPKKKRQIKKKLIFKISKKSADKVYKILVIRAKKSPSSKITPDLVCRIVEKTVGKALKRYASK